MKFLLNKLAGTPKNIAGLDIGSSSIKFVEIQGDSLENATLVHYAIEPIPRDLAAEDGTFQNMEAISDLIRKCWKKSGSTLKHVTVALPQSSIISKKAQLPIVDSEEDLKFQVQNEITKYLPTGLSEDDIALDFFTYGSNEQSPTDNDMLLVAAKKDKIDERTGLIEGAGLIPVILDAEHFSLQNMLRAMIGEDFNHKNYLLADCSASVLRIIVFRKGEIAYNKDNQIGGYNLTQDIMNNMGVSAEEAEIIKIKGSSEELYEMVLKTFLNNYASEFLRSFQYFATQSSDPEIAQVYLTGGVAATKGLEDALYKAVIESEEQNITSKPQIAHPLAQMNKGNRIDLAKFASDESSLFLASGLAIRHFLRKY